MTKERPYSLPTRERTSYLLIYSYTQERDPVDSVRGNLHSALVTIRAGIFRFT